MMMLPPGWTRDLSRTQALKALGNAVVWPQAAAGLLQIARIMERHEGAA
jgi:hypothetical protein